MQMSGKVDPKEQWKKISFLNKAVSTSTDCSETVTKCIFKLLIDKNFTDRTISLTEGYEADFIKFVTSEIVYS